MTHTISLSSYDVVEMPDVLSRASPRDWKDADAREYHLWLSSMKPKRIALIMEAARVSRSDPRGAVFRAISELLRRSIANLATATESGQIANGLGLVASFDAALVVGDYLVDDIPDARWCIMKSRIKTLNTRNMTVVRRRLSMAFEPFWEGRQILTLLGRADMQHSAVLQFKFDRWADDLLLDDLGDR